jgi:hypothetical protein
LNTNPTLATFLDQLESGQYAPAFWVEALAPRLDKVTNDAIHRLDHQVRIDGRGNAAVTRSAAQTIGPIVRLGTWWLSSSRSARCQHRRHLVHFFT